MKPNLVIGLGNALMGDEGVGWHAVDRLARDPRLPEDTEVLWGGTDLLRLEHQMEGRRRVILIDALLDPERAGVVSVLEEPIDLEERQEGVHHLSPAQAIGLLRFAAPPLRAVRFTLVAVGIAEAQHNPELSRGLARGLPEVVERVIRELAARTG
jgi:hydrogenase maturation protease